MIDQIPIPDANDFRSALASFLRKYEVAIMARYAAALTEQHGLTVLPYYSLNFDVAQLPILILEQRKWDVRWVGLPAIADVTFDCTIHGMVHHNDPEMMDRLSAALAGGVVDVLDRRHVRLPLGPQLEMFFDDALPPLTNVQFGAIPMNSSTVLRGWMADFRGKARLSIIPIYPEPETVETTP